MNKTIPQLPEQTGVTVNDLLAIVDSGETVTSKIKVSTLLSAVPENVYERGTGSSSIKPVDGTNTASNTYSTVLNGTGNTASGLYTIVSGQNNNAAGDNGFIIGGVGNNTTGFATGYGGIIGGQNNTSGRRAGAVFGTNNNVGNDGYTFGTNSYSNTSQNNPGRCAVVVGGANHVNNVNLSPYHLFLGGLGNKMFTNNSAGFDFILGGTLNWISSTGTYSNPSRNNWTGDTNSIINSKNCNIQKGTLTTILNSDGCVSSALNRTTIIGLTGYTATENDTTYVKHSKTVGQSVNTFYDNLSGDTFTIDWNEGNLQKIYMTGNTALTFSNVKNGATYKLQVVNGGTHSITGVTASGFTILCEGGSIPNITNNGVDLCVLEVMGTDILVRHFGDFSTP